MWTITSDPHEFPPSVLHLYSFIAFVAYHTFPVTYHICLNSFLLLILPQDLTPNIVQTDDDGHYYFPGRSKCPLSQLLIGADAYEGGGRKE